MITAQEAKKLSLESDAFALSYTVSKAEEAILSATKLSKRSCYVYVEARFSNISNQFVEYLSDLGYFIASRTPGNQRESQEIIAICW